MSHIMSRCVVLILFVGTAVTATGCATLKSPTTWFSGKKEDSPTFETDLTQQSKGFTGQVKSMGAAVSSAFSKTKAVITAPFSSDKKTVDPETSLANMPTPGSLGPEIWVTQGQLFESKGNYEKALENYSKALELEPNNEAALLSTARLHSRNKSHNQAASYFEKAVALNPAASTRNELALEYQAVGNHQEAMKSVMKAIELEPSNVRYRNNYASMLVATGRTEEAVKNLEQVFSPAIANYNVAYLQERNGDSVAARERLQFALQQDPNLAPARNLMAKISSSPAMQTAQSTYGVAQQALQTAQTIATPNFNNTTIPAAATESLPGLPSNVPSITQPQSFPQTAPAVGSIPSVPLPEASALPSGLPKETVIAPELPSGTSTLPEFSAPGLSVPKAADALPYPPLQ